MKVRLQDSRRSRAVRVQVMVTAIAACPEGQLLHLAFLDGSGRTAEAVSPGTTFAVGEKSELVYEPADVPVDEGRSIAMH
jgi:hypothetical protein